MSGSLPVRPGGLQPRQRGELPGSLDPCREMDEIERERSTAASRIAPAVSEVMLKGVDMKKVKRRGADAKGILLTVVVLCIVLAALSSVGLAATGQTQARRSIRQAMVFDPFALRAVVASSASPDGPPENPPGLVKNPNSRRPIRVPFRPPVRSAFRPGLDLRGS